MEITQVKIFPVHEDKLKAFVSIVFDHCFMINDIKVIQGRDGLFLSMPSRRKKNGEFKDVAHPLNNETRRLVEERVLAEYWDVVDDPTPRRPVTPAVDAEAGGTLADENPGVDPSVGEAAAGGVASGAVAVSESSDDAAGSGEGKTLEEVEEIHLRDSFWTVT